jgi:hypothetical protein
MNFFIQINKNIWHDKVKASLIYFNKNCHVVLTFFFIIIYFLYINEIRFKFVTWHFRGNFYCTRE